MVYYFNLPMNWNQLSEAKAHSSVNHHTRSAKDGTSVYPQKKLQPAKA